MNLGSFERTGQKEIWELKGLIMFQSVGGLSMQIDKRKKNHEVIVPPSREQEHSIQWLLDPTRGGKPYASAWTESPPGIIRPSPQLKKGSSNFLSHYYSFDSRYSIMSVVTNFFQQYQPAGCWEPTECKFFLGEFVRCFCRLSAWRMLILIWSSDVDMRRHIRAWCVATKGSEWLVIMIAQW